MSEYHLLLDIILKNIKSLMKKRGLNINDLAYLAEMHRASMSRIMSGKVNITLKTMCRIAEALEVPAGKLLSS